MAKQFQPDDGHLPSFSDMSWLCEEGLQNQIGDESYSMDDFGTYHSNNVSHPDDLVGAVDKHTSFWGPLQVPSSMPSSLNPSLVSNSYDNRDFDITESSTLGQSSLMLADVELPIPDALRYWDCLDVPTSIIQPDVGNRSLVVSTSQQTPIIESQRPNTTQKRKRAACSVVSEEINSSLIDKEYALKLCVKHIRDPTIGVIESVAKDFGFSFEFVMDLCCWYRKNRFSDFLGPNNTEGVQHSSSASKESKSFTVSTKDGPNSGVRVEELTTTTISAKRPKLDTKAQQITGKDTTTRSHRCPDCAQTFSRHPDLIRHQKIHSPAQIHCPYPRCNKSFTRKDKFNDHWRRKHSDSMPQSNISQHSQDYDGEDPESGGSQGSNNSSGRGGNGQGGSSFQNSQNRVDSAHQGWPSYGGSSCSSFSLEADLVEFYPALAGQAKGEYLRKFAAAKVLQKLGRGGFGSVYGISVNTGSNAEHCEVFACKTISLPQRCREEVIERARNEISILQLLNHPQIIKFSGALILRDCIFINSQPLADLNLKSFLAEQSLPISNLTKSQIWNGARGLVSALAYVHSYGKGNGYHGDLKPENILVLRKAEPSPYIELSLADFGSAWISHSNYTVGPKNRAVTLKYCAPECSMDKSIIGSQGDVWSLGCVFAEIITYLHDKSMDDFDSFQPCNGKKWTYNERLPALNDWLHFLSLNWRQSAYPTIRVEHVDLIQKMLLPGPEDRPSAAEVISRLEAIDKLTIDTFDQECMKPMVWMVEQPSTLSKPVIITFDGMSAGKGGPEAIVRLPLQWKDANLKLFLWDSQVQSLRFAASMGCELVVRVLLERSSRHADEALVYAAAEGHEALVRLLLERDTAGADRALVSAAAKGHVAIARLLLERGTTGADKAMVGAARGGHEAIVQLLLEKGAEVESKDNNSVTPLFWAAENGHDAIVRLLLEKGAELESKEKYNDQTALSYAAEKGREQSYRNQDVLGFGVGYLPKGFPIALPTKLAWNGSALTERTYTYYLTKDNISEIEGGLAAFKALKLDGDLVNHETFPLPKLQHVLRDLCNDIHNGKGFFVLRGLDPEKYSVEESMIIFLGIQSYIGEHRARQDDYGNMIVHVIPDSTTTSSRSLHARHSDKSIAFHTGETGDIVAWQTRNTAAHGGRCIISSAHTIYNVLAATRPDIISTLAQPEWPFALPHFQRRPVLFYHASHLIINYSPAALFGTATQPRPSHLPSLTPQQREALEVVEAIARATELKITTRPGDLHFINNLAVLHRRDEFIDDEAKAEATDVVKSKGKNKRHLVRMRIRNQELGWDLPDCLKGSWEEVFGEEGWRVWHLEPMPEGFSPLRKYSGDAFSQSETHAQMGAGGWVTPTRAVRPIWPKWPVRMYRTNRFEETAA